ncbi:unnamed protein product [Rhodiola kirilowii]
MSRHPEVKWAEREDKVFVTVQLPNAADAKVVLEPEGVFGFTASGGADMKPYEIKLNLHDKVNVEESKINVGPRNIFCIIEKAEKQWWKKLVKDAKAPHYVKVDWDKWVDEDDDEPAAAEPDMGGMDFSKFSEMGGMGGLGGMGGMGGLGGMGGMGGLGGMGGMGGLEGLGGMGGMGGLGGMGGMGGLGGMGDMGEFDDSDDEGEEASSHQEKDGATAAEDAPEKLKEAEA